MFKSAATLTSIFLAFGCAAFSVLSGCDTSERQADRAAQKKVDTADQSRSEAVRPAQLDMIQQQYDSAAQGGVSPAMRLIVRSRAGQLRFERVQGMLADLRGKDLQVAQTIKDIEQLALQIAGAQSSIAAMKSIDPASQITALQQRMTEITGGPNQATWTVTGTQVTAPTIAALQAEIQDRTDKIAANTFESGNLKQQSASLVDKAETLRRKSEGETGDQQAADVTQASKYRHDAAVADAQIETLAAKLVQLQNELETATIRKDAVQNTIAAIKVQIDALQTDWTSVQKQIDAQLKLQQQMIAGDGSAPAARVAPAAPVAADAPAAETPGAGASGAAGEAASEKAVAEKSRTISDRAATLARLLSESKALRESAGTELDKLIADFHDAGTQADMIRRDLMPKAAGTTDADAPIWRDMMETLNPTSYKLQEAAALQARATVAASQAAQNVMIAQMMSGYQITPAEAGESFKGMDLAAPTAPMKIAGLGALLAHDRTGVEMPKPLADLGAIDPAELKKMQGDVDDKFKEALAAYEKPSGGIDSGPSAKDRKNMGFMGHALTNRLWAEYEFLIGDPAAAKQRLADAETDEAQVDAAFRNGSPTAANAAAAAGTGAGSDDSAPATKAPATAAPGTAAPDTATPGTATPGAPAMGGATDSPAVAAPAAGDTAPAPATGAPATPAPVDGATPPAAPSADAPPATMPAAPAPQ